ncbi:hypothetical protein ACRALDRAFT_1083226 [Sodiomyces alcalophilus JCM 7366]|uniref:uncharacterized protein n=1 Tax=Sodiomyces alcalophilus JCM 7366 TaxID=591952 RepID=UPI0039B4866D
MTSKRKRDDFFFDPNQSDPDDQNFEPGENRRSRSRKRSRPSKSSKNSRRRNNRYRGSDIEDHDDISDSEAEASFEDDVVEDDDDDDDLPVNAAGRKTRRAAAKPVKYEETEGSEESEDEDDGGGDEEDEVDEEVKDKENEAGDSDDSLIEVTAPKRKSRRKNGAVEEVDDASEEPKAQLTKVVKLKVGRSKLKSALAAGPQRRTRSQTEEADEELVELSNSGRHARLVSRSRSPETKTRTRSSRAAKGLAKPPETIVEATEESNGHRPEDDDELAGHHEDVAADAPADAKMEDAPAEEADAPDDAPLADGVAAPEAEEEDEEDDVPITRGRSTRARRTNGTTNEDEEPKAEETGKHVGRRLTRRSALRKSKSAQEPSSDFEPGDESAEDAALSDSSAGNANQEDDDVDLDSPTPRGRRGRTKGRSAKSSRRGADSDDEVELDRDELADELEDLREASHTRSRRARRRPSPAILYQETVSKRRRAAAKPMNYFMPPVTAAHIEEDDDMGEDHAPTPARRRGRGGASQAWDRPLNTTFGPFGGGGIGSLLGGPWGTGATGGVDSDSSDDEMGHRSGMAGNVGMTPTSGGPGALLPGLTQTYGDTGIGAAPNVGKVKNQKALADADPLGVDLNVDFSQVGGLEGHIDQLKEMVQLPLLYPELFQRFHVTPPRGVLFHGPPGTGKTLLARALANSVGIGGRKITFYMRKGADALSKWVGEAEKQLRLLFEEARRTQPSIIFFDEIDGLAPVRSSKQEQIHASIVSTLLALMDGMDGRGQVIVIGATNRPDNIDPALRRPGRFDREFYFPLPDLDGRRCIIDIHTKDWGLSDNFKHSLAESTKGYGGADLRALCTEAALNAIQRTYPQIYGATDKLVVDPTKINVHAADFMTSIKKMVPSSERSAGSGAASLPKSIEPLLRDQFNTVKEILNEILPRKKNLTPLEEAMFEQFDDDDHGFGREQMHQEFERSRVFRPRFLISGLVGMGQAYLSSALLHYFEGVRVQNFGLPNLLADGRPVEQVIVSLFTEVKRHKPSVIYIPNIDSWYTTLGDTVGYVTFKALLKSIPPTDPILVLATAEYENGDNLDPVLWKDIFAYSSKNRLEIARPKAENRREYFKSVLEYIRKSPTDFPDPAQRKKRVLEKLPLAPPPPPRAPSKEEEKAMYKRDRQLLNILKVQLQPIMDQINRKYRKFRQPVIPTHQLEYLFLESDPNYIRPDVPGAEERPFEIVKDKYGNDVLRETETGKTFYNLETTTIEERLSNGFYAHPEDFLFDIKTLAKDAKKVGDKERTLKANELVSNVEVDVAAIQANGNIDWEGLRARQLQRAMVAAEKERKRKAMQSMVNLVQSDTAAVANDSDSQGPVTLGEPIPGTRHTSTRFQPMSPPSNGIRGRLASRGLSNGTAQPPVQSDVRMGGVDEDDTQAAAAPAVEHTPTKPQSEGRAEGLASADASTGAAAGTTQLSQKSAVTTVPPGVSPSALVNDASTTKTTDPSDRSSSKWSTQLTNGFPADQNTQSDFSQLLDTQQPAGVQSNPGGDDSWAHSQADGLARGGFAHPGDGPGSFQFPRPSSSLHDSPSNEHVRNPGNSGSSPSQQPVIHEGQVENFLDDLTERTSGCTIEQLEQINRELMDEIWKTRGEWNRMKVLGSVKKVFNETISDIEHIQGLLQPSQ